MWESAHFSKAHLAILNGFIIREARNMTSALTYARAFAHSTALSLIMSCAAAAAAPTAAPTPATAAPDWAAIATTDFRFVLDNFRTQHAGIAAGDPSVIAPLAWGERAGLAEAAAVRTEQDYQRLMKRFISSFGDPHTGINVHLQTRGWTGLVLDQVEGGYRVVWSEPGWPNALPPVGAIAQSCDGVWSGTYLQTQAAPFTSRSVEYARTFSALARQVMFENGLGWTPEACVFTLADGSRKRYALPLQAVPAQVSSERIDTVRAKFSAEARPVGVTPFAAGKYWIGMPDFDGARSGAAYEALYPKLAALARPAWVVFDLRGNGGGNSDWGQRALKALYGNAYADRLGEAGASSKYLVASPASVDRLKRNMGMPEFADSKESNGRDLVKVEAALRAGQKLALVDGDADAQALTAQTWPRPHGPRIAAVIDRTCFSSCMSFLLYLRAAGDTVVLGEPTAGYSPFGEITGLDLPSGHGQVGFPTAWFKSTQGTREPFNPDIPYPGNMADDAALMKWVNTTLDRLQRH